MDLLDVQMYVNVYVYCTDPCQALRNLLFCQTPEPSRVPRGDLAARKNLRPGPQNKR